MANIALITISNEWTKLETLIKAKVPTFSFVAGTKYQIQYRGNSAAYFCESADVPSEQQEGTMFPQASKPAEYEKEDGADLYVRAETAGVVNIAVKGGGDMPTGTITITENGVYDVTNYASADVQVAGGETITVTNYSSAPVTEGEQVLIAKWWDQTLQEELMGIRDRGWFSTNEYTVTGVALADADVNAEVAVKVLLGEFYYADLIFDTVPPTAVPHTTYFNRYEGSNYIESSDFLEVPYYTTVTGVVKAEGYKPYTINETVQNEDVELHIELEPATPLLIITNAGTGNYYYANDLDNISFSSGANSAEMNGAILSDGNGLYVGDGTTSSTSYYYSTDGVNWTDVDCGFANPVLTLNNGSIIANSTSETTYLKLDADTFEEEGEKTNATDVLLNGGYGDYVSYGYDSVNEELFSNWTLFPENTYQLSTIHSSNVIEKWGFAWVTNWDSVNSINTLCKIDGNTITTMYTENSSHYNFLVDAGDELLLINQYAYMAAWAISYDSDTDTVSVTLLGNSNILSQVMAVYGACYYDGTLYLLANYNGTVVLYKSTDNARTFTEVTATALSSLPYDKGNLLTIGYI